MILGVCWKCNSYRIIKSKKINNAHRLFILGFIFLKSLINLVLN